MCLYRLLCNRMMQKKHFFTNKQGVPSALSFYHHGRHKDISLRIIHGSKLLVREGRRRKILHLYGSASLNPQP